ncbi:MAG: MFS transporter, partial [Ignavibacteriaceae bacterium]|nr:MFS transporter [Ignavibacteriaceae bacterium]
MKIIKTLKELPKDMWIIAVSTLINRTGTMVIPFLALYLTSQLKLSASYAGFIITVYGLGALVTAPFVGKLADKVGAFTVIKLSLFFSGAMLLLYPHFTDYYLILGITFVWAIIGEAYRPASLALIMEIVKPEQRKTAIALNRLMINAGMSIGPVVAGFLTMISYSIIFYVDAATSILAAIFLIFYPIVQKIESTETDEKLSSHKLFVLKDTPFIIFLLALLPASMVMFQHIGALPLYIVNGLGYTPAVFGLIAMVNTVLIILIEVPLNASMGKWAEKKS